MIILLLSGKAEAGKDTFFDVAAEQYNNLRIKRIAFADALKKIAFDMGWDGHKDAAGRRLLQDLGEVGRRYRPTLWVDKTISTLSEYSDAADIVCFTDCRYPNELESIKNAAIAGWHVVTIRIERPRHSIAVNQDHISEVALDQYNFDYTILNDSTLAAYSDQVLAVTTTIAKRFSLL